MMLGEGESQKPSVDFNNKLCHSWSLQCVFGLFSLLMDMQNFLALAATNTYDKTLFHR